MTGTYILLRGKINENGRTRQKAGKGNVKHLIIALCMISFVSCGPQYVQDPNASVLVTVQYDDGLVKIVPNDDCKPQLDCKGMSEVECAVALYHDSERFVKEGEKLIAKKLYLSARVEFMQALTRLSESGIRIERAKLNNYEDYKVVVQFKLDYKVKQRIMLCERLIRFTQWQQG